MNTPTIFVVTPFGAYFADRSGNLMNEGSLMVAALCDDESADWDNASEVTEFAGTTEDLSRLCVFLGCAATAACCPPVEAGATFRISHHGDAGTAVDDTGFGGDLGYTYEDRCAVFTLQVGQSVTLDDGVANAGPTVTRLS